MIAGWLMPNFYQKFSYLFEVDSFEILGTIQLVCRVREAHSSFDAFQEISEILTPNDKYKNAHRIQSMPTWKRHQNAYQLK